MSHAPATRERRAGDATGATRETAFSAPARHASRRRRTLALATALAATATLAGGCLAGRTVPRISGSRVTEGPAISAEAYGAFAEGVLAEQDRAWLDARAAYRRALDEDAESAEVWTRLGAVDCARGALEDAAAEFAEAEARDGDYAGLWRERALCALGTGNPDEAARLARRATEEDPDGEDATLVLARALEASGDRAAALGWLRGYVVLHPNAWRVWTALRDAATAAASVPDERRATRALASVKGETPSAEALDEALASGDLGRAREVAVALGQPSAALALRAAALGRYDLAQDHAALVLAADPDNSDAWIALFVARAAMSREAPPAVAELVGQTPPSALAARLLAAELARRFGSGVARAWLTARPPLPPPGDAIEASLDSAWK